MDYEKTIPFEGDVGKAMETARGVLMQHGFEIEAMSDKELELTGPFMFLNKGDNPLRGISAIRLSLSGELLAIEAEFGIIRKTMKYLVVFILGMALLLFAVFGIVFRNNPDFNWWLSVLPFAPWPILIPLIGKFMKYRTSRAIDVLMNNMIATGK